MASTGIFNLTANTTTGDIAIELSNDDLINVEAKLDNTGATLALGAVADDNIPTVNLESGGTILGGVINDQGGGVVAAGGTLDDVIYEGTLDDSSGSLFIDDGITTYGLNGPGTGPGAVNLGDVNLYFDNTQTFDDDVVTMTSGSEIAEYTTSAAYQNNGDVSPPETLTFGAKLVIDQTAGTGYITDGGDVNYGLNPGAVTIVNDGQINAQGSNTTLLIYPQVFDNAGTLAATGTGTTIQVYSGAFTNTGTISVASGDTFQLGSTAGQTYTTSGALGGTFNAASGTVEIYYATLNNAGSTLKIGAGAGIGTLYLYNATIAGGTIVDSGSGLTSSNGTLDGVTYQGTLNLQSGSLYIDDGLTGKGSGGTGPGAVNLGDVSLNFDNTQTFDDDVVTMTSGATIEEYTTLAAYQNNGNVSPAETLTFGANLVIDQTAGTGYITDSGYVNYGANPGVVTIVNDGQINVQGSGSVLEVYSGAFTNTGTISVASGDTFQLGSGPNQTYTTAAAFGGTFNAGSGTVEIYGATLNNAGATLKIGASNGIGTLELAGEVSGGTIADSGSDLTSSNGTLNNVKYEGALSLTSGNLYLDDDVTFTGAGGTGPGQVSVNDSSLYIDNTQTLDDETISLTGGAYLVQYTTAAAYQNNNNVYPNETLTIGAKATVEVTSGTGYLYNSGYYTTGTSFIVNDGYVYALGSGSAASTVYIYNPGTFTNDNVMLATDNGVIQFASSSAVGNISADATYGGDVLTGGTWEIEDGGASTAGGGDSTIAFNQSGALGITTLGAYVLLDGANAAMTSAGTNLAASLRDIAKGGDLTLEYDAVSGTQADFNGSTVTSLTVDGELNIYGSLLQVGGLVIDSGAEVTGVGETAGATAENAEILGGVQNSGLIVAGEAPTFSLDLPKSAIVATPEDRFYIDGPVTNTSGTIEIEGSTVLELSGAAKGGQIVFENNAIVLPQTLALDTGTLNGSNDKVTATIAGFENGDVIDLTNSNFNFANLTGHSFNGTTLTLNFGATTAKLTFSGLSANANFQFASDNATGTDISVACFARGALIATPRGEVAIEDLRAGDEVLTASGATRPVVWVGHRALDLTTHPEPQKVYPVRISADAFGPGLPRRDLWVSPGHNLALEGALIPASALVNGISVAQVEVERVEYWHVELDAHDVVLAEGLPSESYLDCGNRAAFVNGGAFIEAHPDFRPKHWADTCLPLALEGPAVAAAKARLLARLAAQGFEVTPEADAHVVVDGRRVAPIHVSPTRLAFVLPRGGREIELRSHTFVPAHTVAQSHDPRALGLCVAGLQIDGSPVALEADVGPGWHEGEFDGGRFAHRWTTGATPLPAGAQVVIVDLAERGYYWAAPETPLALCA